MGAPCINDTCSIAAKVSSIDHHLELSVILNAAGGLECIDGSGIQASIYGDPANVPAASIVDTCFQQLRRSDAGELYAIPHRGQSYSFSGDVVNIPQGGAGEGTESSNSISTGGTVTNPYSCQALAIVYGRFEVGYSISDTAIGNQTPQNPTITGGFIPYNADIRCRFKMDGTPMTVSYMDIGGTVPSGLNNSNKRRWEYFVMHHIFAGGASVTYTATANHEGNNESVNVSTINPAAAPAFADRGFRVVGKTLFLPFNGVDN